MSRPRAYTGYSRTEPEEDDGLKRGGGSRIIRNMFSGRARAGADTDPGGNAAASSHRPTLMPTSIMKADTEADGPMTGFPAREATRRLAFIGEVMEDDEHFDDDDADDLADALEPSDAMALLSTSAPGPGKDAALRLRGSTRTRISSVTTAIRSGAGGSGGSGGGSGSAHTAASLDKGGKGDKKDRGDKSVHGYRHVHRTNGRRCCGSGCGAFARWSVEQLATTTVVLGVMFAAIGAGFYFMSPESPFLQNKVYQWMLLGAAACACLIFLSMAEWALFVTIEGFAGMNRYVGEIVDFVDAARGRVAPIATIVLALLFRQPAFGLTFDEPGTFFFERACGALLIFQVGLVVKAAALKVILRRLYSAKHRRPVADVLRYAGIARRVTAPIYGFAARTASLAARRQAEAELAGDLGGFDSGAHGASTCEEVSAAACKSGASRDVEATAQHPGGREPLRATPDPSPELTPRSEAASHLSHGLHTLHAAQVDSDSDRVHSRSSRDYRAPPHSINTDVAVDVTTTTGAASRSDSAGSQVSQLRRRPHAPSVDSVTASSSAAPQHPLHGHYHGPSAEANAPYPVMETLFCHALGAPAQHAPVSIVAHQSVVPTSQHTRSVSLSGHALDGATDSESHPHDHHHPSARMSSSGRGRPVSMVPSHATYATRPSHLDGPAPVSAGASPSTEGETVDRRKRWTHRRRLTPERLSFESFWVGAGYVREHGFSLYDPHCYLCVSHGPEGVQELGDAAFDRLLAEQHARERIRAERLARARMLAAQLAEAARREAELLAAATGLGDEDHASAGFEGHGSGGDEHASLSGAVRHQVGSFVRTLGRGLRGWQAQVLSSSTPAGKAGAATVGGRVGEPSGAPTLPLSFRSDYQSGVSGPPLSGSHARSADSAIEHHNGLTVAVKGPPPPTRFNFNQQQPLSHEASRLHLNRQLHASLSFVSATSGVPTSAEPGLHAPLTPVGTTPPQQRGSAPGPVGPLMYPAAPLLPTAVAPTAASADVADNAAATAEADPAGHAAVSRPASSSRSPPPRLPAAVNALTGLATALLSPTCPSKTSALARTPAALAVNSGWASPSGGLSTGRSSVGGGSLTSATSGPRLPLIAPHPPSDVCAPHGGDRDGGGGGADSDEDAPGASTTLHPTTLIGCFPNREAFTLAYSLFDLDGDGRVGRDEFVNALKLMAGAWGGTQTSLGSYGGISGAISVVAGMLYWIVCVIAMLLLFSIDLSKAYAPVAVLVSGLGFALGPPCQRALDSLLFVIIISPFEVGDRVQIDKINNGAPMVVSQVFVVTSEFNDLASGKRIIARNADLTGMTITNLRRSPNAAFTSKFVLDASCATPEALSALHGSVTAHVKARPLDWKPACAMSVTFIEPNKVEVGFSVTHHASWSEGAKIWPAHSALVVAATQAMRAQGLRYSLPRQQVELVGDGAGDVLQSRARKQPSCTGDPSDDSDDDTSGAAGKRRADHRKNPRPGASSHHARSSKLSHAAAAQGDARGHSVATDDGGSRGPVTPLHRAGPESSSDHEAPHRQWVQPDNGRAGESAADTGGVPEPVRQSRGRRHRSSLDGLRADTVAASVHKRA